MFIQIYVYMHICIYLCIHVYFGSSRLTVLDPVLGCHRRYLGTSSLGWLRATAIISSSNPVLLPLTMRDQYVSVRMNYVQLGTQLPVPHWTSATHPSSVSSAALHSTSMKRIVCKGKPKGLATAPIRARAKARVKAKDLAKADPSHRLANGTLPTMKTTMTAIQGPSYLKIMIMTNRMWRRRCSGWHLLV